MNKQEKAIIRQFKNELRARLDYSKRMKDLEDKILLLDAQFAVHSPTMSDVHFTAESRDSKLASYITKKQKYQDELDLLERQAQKVDSYLALMNPKVAFHLRNVYLGAYTLEDAGRKMNLTCNQFRFLVDKEILRVHALM